MARKTQNSSQSLSSAIAQTLLADEVSPPTPRTSGRKRRNTPQKPATTKEQTTPRQPLSHGEDGGPADGQRNTDEELEEVDATDDQLREPAVIAPSVRPSKGDDNEQAGLVKSENINRSAAIQGLDQNEGGDNNLDDDDYAGVDDISDSSDEEPDAAEITENIKIDAKPTTNHLRWYEHEEKIQGVLGENESFFDQHHWAGDLGSNVSTGDEFDYHTAWDTLPGTPIEPRTPMSLPSHSREPSCYESPNSSRRPTSSRFDANHVHNDDDDDIVTRPASAQSDGDSDSNGAASGYESEAETTDEEGPPIPAAEICRAPQVIHHSSPPSLDPSVVDFASRRCSSSAAGRKFKTPSLPASRLRGSAGPKMGTFKVSSSRSHSTVDKTGDDLIFHRAPNPSPSPIPRRPIYNRSVMSYHSAPPTPTMSNATLAPDLSESEFTDAVASQVSLDVDLVLSAGPDFITPAGFSRATSSAIQQAAATTTSTATTVAQPTASSLQPLVPQDSFDEVSFLDRQARGAEPQFDDPEEEDIGEFAFEDMIDFGDLSSDDDGQDESSAVSVSSPLRNTFVADTVVSPSAHAAQRNSPSSASSNRGLDLLGGVDISAWMNSAGQRSPQPSRHSSSKRPPPHGLSLSGNTFRSSRNPSSPSILNSRKRKISEAHGRSTPPVSMNKRRLPAGSR